ncbi:hypothetical protein EMIT0P44_230018 [Pseudomonas sp. IT-P44]
MLAVGTTAKIGFGRRSASAGLRGGDSEVSEGLTFSSSIWNSNELGSYEKVGLPHPVAVLAAAEEG